MEQVVGICAGSLKKIDTPRPVGEPVPAGRRLGENHAPGMPLDDSSPYGLWRLPRHGNRFLGGLHGELLSPRTQLFRSLVIAPVVCGGGGRMGVRGVNVQICGRFMVALGHCVLQIPVSDLALSSAVSLLTIPGAVQSNTVQITSCFRSTLTGMMDDSYQFAHGEPGAEILRPVSPPACGLQCSPPMGDLAVGRVTGALGRTQQRQPKIFQAVRGDDADTHYDPPEEPSL